MAEAFQSRFREAACEAIRGWERDLNELGNCLVRLHNVCEAAADEEEAIARAVAGGFPPPTRYQDVVAAFVAWERRTRQRRPFTPPSGGSGGGFVAVHPDRVRQAAQLLLDARGEFDASYRRLTGPFRDVGLEAPEELGWVVEDSERLARELRGRADAFEAAEAQVRHAAATALAGTFSGLLAPMAATASAGKPEGRDPRRRVAADAKRLVDELRPGGVFDLVDFEKGRKLAAEAERASKEDPRYAAAFLRALGPDNLRWLIEHGQLDPCVLGALVARGSQAGIGADFLTKTLGTDRFDAPRRAALLSACSCPTAMFHAVWVERMATTLLTGRDPPGKGDPRKWYREAAANLLGTHPAGAIRFINRHQQLACRALFSHDDKGGRAAQGAVDDMLLHPPAGLEKQAEDALERVVTCAVSNEFSPEGKQALARLLARPETLRSVTSQVMQRESPALARERGFNVRYADLQTVLSDLMVDAEARRVLLDAANTMAAEELQVAFADPGGSRRALEAAGAAFGALASRPYPLEAALDARGLAADTARNLVGSVGGVVLDVAKAHPVVSLAVEGGSAILFDLGETSAEQRRLEEELRAERGAAEARETLKGDLTRNLEHLAYVSVLADPEERAALALRLSPADLPAEVPAGLNLNVASRDEWARDLFDERGQLLVPQPSDPGRWKSFLAWSETVNPELRNRISALTDPMFDSFDLARRT
jgi:hypothetical protein